MKDFFNAFKTSGLFIGTVIGAGFSTGEEIRAYFKGTSDLTVVLSAFLFAVFCAIFLFASKHKKIKLPKCFNAIWKVAKFIAVGISLIAMCSAGESVVYKVFGIKSFGVWLFFICVLLGDKGNRVLAMINAVAVPIIVVFVICVYLKAETCGLDIGKINFIPAFLYSAMNIFSGGIMLDRVGKNMSKKEIYLSTTISFFIMCALILCIKKSVENCAMSMPILAIALDNKMVIVGVTVVVLAIFTTMLSDVSIMLEDLSHLSQKKWIRLLILCPFCLIGIVSDFSGIVNSLYYYIGYCGVAYVIYATVRLFFADFSFKNRNARIHYACKSAKYNSTCHH